MARDYYSVLARATSTLEPNTAAARHALYDRARLTIMDAGLASSETASERSALEAAIDRIETEMRQAGARSAPLRQAYGQRPKPPAFRPQRSRAGVPALQLARAPTFRTIALAAVAILIIGALGFAGWLWRATPRGEASRAASATKVQSVPSTDGSGDASPSYILRRQIVYYRTIYPVGTIVIAKSQRYLYLVRPNVAAVRYTIGIGRECANAVGMLAVSAKQTKAESRPPNANAAGPSARPVMRVGAEERLVPRSLVLGDTGLHIEGVEAPIKNGAEGCIMLVNEDLIDLYDHVVVGTRVVIS